MPPSANSDYRILNSINGGFVVLDQDARVTTWNAWMATASGISADDARRKTLSELFPGADLRRVMLAVQSALATNTSTIITHALNPSLFPLLTRSQRTLLHDVTVSPIEDGRGLECLIHITDVTMATRREKYLREQQNARYDAVVESAPDVILTIDEEGVVQLANPAAAAQFGFSAADLVGRSAASLFDSKDAWAEVWRQAIAEDAIAQQREVTARRKDGTISYLEASGSRWSSGSRIFVTVILRDINERRAAEVALRRSEGNARAAAQALAELNLTLEQRVKDRTDQLMKAEEALRQGQKMEAIGQLTGGIAHDFNNLLQGITGALNLLQKRIAAGRISETERFITGAVESAQRAAALTHRLLAFSRQQPIDPRPVDENNLIASVEELLRRTIGETIQLRFAPAADLWLVRCDANQLENAVLNLSINARDAMPTGGVLTIETSNQTLSSSDAKAWDVKPGDYVMLRVKDTGAGMPREVQARAFDPFFTTKAIGKGTGLGLSMIYGFVRQSEGAVRIFSEVGKGSSIEICLPRFHGDLEVASSAQDDGDNRTEKGEVVLVVEDEAVVRLLVVEVLKELGYYPLEAVDGASALRILGSSQRIDLLITDLGLPDINGRAVADEALTRRKNLPVLFMTGYAAQAAGDAFLADGMEIITKPFTMEVLAARVRDIIATVPARTGARTRSAGSQIL